MALPPRTRLRFVAGRAAVVWVAVLVMLAGCSHQPVAEIPPQPQSIPRLTIDQVAGGYVRLVLAMDAVDPGYIDAYYGPISWRETARAQPHARVDLLGDAQVLITALGRVAPPPGDASFDGRRRLLRNQLGALSARVRLLQGLRLPFDDESRALYDVEAPRYTPADFEPALQQIASLLPPVAPGASTRLPDRYNAYRSGFAIPPARLAGVLRAALAASRAATLAHLPLPGGEHIDLALVAGQAWSAYARYQFRYQGDFTSRLEVSTDQPMTIADAIDLATREGYPGHHAINLVQDQQLARTRGWVEYTVHPLPSPQSFIAEGCAGYAAALAFPALARRDLENKLFALAGLDAKEVPRYDRIVEATKALAPVGLEAARRYLDGSLTAAQTEDFLREYALAASDRARQQVGFFDRYRSYIVNYSDAGTLVARYIHRVGGDDTGSEAQWRVFHDLLVNPRLPPDLDETGVTEGGVTPTPPPTVTP